MYLQSLESNKSAIIKAIKAECRAQGKEEEEEEMDRCQRGAAAVANPFVKLAPPCHVSRMQHTSYMLRRQFQWCGDVSNWMQILYILVGTYWWKNCTLFVERKSWGMRMHVAAVHGDYLYIEKLSVLVLEFRRPTEKGTQGSQLQLYQVSRIRLRTCALGIHLISPTFAPFSGPCNMPCNIMWKDFLRPDQSQDCIL